MTLKEKALQAFEMSETSHPTMQCHIPEDWNLQQHHCGHLTSYSTVNFVRQFSLVGVVAPACPSLCTVLLSQVDTGTV